MTIFLYIAVIVLVCVGIVLFFVLYNKKNEKIKQKLKDAGEFDKTVIEVEKVSINTDENTNLNQVEVELQTEKSNKSEAIAEQTNAKDTAPQKAEDGGVFEDFSLEDEPQPKQKENSSDEEINPFFKKKFFFDDDTEETDDELANDPFDNFDGFEKYKQMLREEREKIDADDFDDEFYTPSHKDTLQMNEELKKILLDENKSDEEDE